MNMNPNTPSSARTSALPRLLGFVLIVLLVISSLVLLLFLARFALTWVVVPFFVEKYVSELGRVAGWGRDITWAVIAGAVFVVSYVVGFVFRRGPGQRRAALGALAALGVSYFSLHAWFTRDQLYDQSGQPLFYWGLTPLGEIFKQPEPGINPYTGIRLLPASLDYFVLIRTRLREPLRQVDPATHDWFDLNCGYPLLWYVRNSNGGLEFYPRPAIHPRYRTELQPVSVELLHEWEREQARRQAEAEVQAQAQERRLEVARLRDEEARREADRARDQQASEDARRMAAEAQAQAKAETERLARLRAAVQQIDRFRAAQRRASEAVAPAHLLDWLNPAGLAARVCPQLTAESFQSAVFTNEFYLRRFRFLGQIVALRKDTCQVTFPIVTCGNLHCLVVATLAPEALRAARLKREFVVAGTLVDIQFSASATNINGAPGYLCTVILANGTMAYREAVAPQRIKTSSSLENSDALFASRSQFRADTTPVQAAVGFPVESTARVVFAPLRLVPRVKSAPSEACASQPATSPLYACAAPGVRSARATQSCSHAPAVRRRPNQSDTLKCKAYSHS
jgi:hypothetical protein